MAGWKGRNFLTPQSPCPSVTEGASAWHRIDYAQQKRCESGSPATASSQQSSGDAVNPQHYKSHPSGVEAVTILEAFNYNIGNAMKYLWRAGLKGDAVTDLRKAAWYIEREIGRLERRT